jgi:uncharacterized membrane protein
MFRHRPRLLTSILAGITVALMLPFDMVSQPITRAIIGWNAGVILYIGLVAVMMYDSCLHKMRLRAQVQDEGSYVVLVAVVLAAIVTIGAIVAELASVKDMHGFARYAHTALAFASIVTAWLFSHLMFAQHYAHDYYLALAHGLPAGLDFPQEDNPDYGDFLYFAFVIGTSGQTADVSFTSKSMRRIGLIHCVLAYFFNATLVALTINIASGLL